MAQLRLERMLFVGLDFDDDLGCSAHGPLDLSNRGRDFSRRPLREQVVLARRQKGEINNAVLGLELNPWKW